MTPNTLTQILTPSAILRAIWRQKNWCAAITFGCLALGVVFLLMSSRKYASEAVLHVRLGRETLALDPSATVNKLPNLQESLENELNSINELLQSRALLEELVDQTPNVHELLEDGGVTVVNADRDNPLSQITPGAVYSLRDEAINKLAANVKINVVKKSNIIHLSFTAKDPELARTVLNRLIALCMKKHVEVNRAEGSLKFFELQVQQVGEQVNKGEVALRDFKNQRKMADLIKEQSLLLDRIGAIETDRQHTAAALASLDQQLAARATKLAELSPTVVLSEVTGSPHSAVEGMRQQLYSLQLREKEILSKYEPIHVQVIQIREQIAQAKKQLAGEKTDAQVTRGVNESFQAIQLAQLNQQAERAGLAARSEVLTAQLAAEHTNLAKLNDYAVELADLERTLTAQNDNLRRYSLNAEQARIDHALAAESISNINIVQQPTLSMTPSSPRTKLTLAFAALAGVMLATLAAVWQEQRRTLYEASLAHYVNAANDHPLTSGHPLTNGAANHYEPAGMAS